MSTFDYIANSLNVKGNVIKKCIHSEQQIEFIMELNRAVVQCPNCHAKTDRITEYRWQSCYRIHFAPTGFCPIT